MSDRPEYEMSPNPAVRRRSSTVGRNRSSSMAASIPTVTKRLRGLSVTLMDARPPPGMWAASGGAIAHAPNLTQLRHPELSDSLGFDAYGHSTHIITDNATAALANETSDLKNINTITIPIRNLDATDAEKVIHTVPSSIALFRDRSQRRTAHEVIIQAKKHPWSVTIAKGLKAFWKFALTPVGIFIIVYGLNVVGWGAMLFFLLLKAAPAMNHPSADSNDSPRKKWLEIDSQILNALFCVTGFGLAPWRFQDFYLLLSYKFAGKRANLLKLAKKNSSWFRLPQDWEATDEGSGIDKEQGPNMIHTATGLRAPPTRMWKLWFFVIMFVLNTLLQCVLSFFMWHYNRIDRPSWATGLFIGLGCGTGMLAGVLTWWEGRKIKKIEGPQLVVQVGTELVGEGEGKLERQGQATAP